MSPQKRGGLILKKEIMREKIIMLTDLGFGDTGKGSITDYLAREYPVHTVVRYNGGAQAGHAVVTPEGKYHKFSQFGSASFIPKTKTHLSRFMFVDPLSMFKEERHLKELSVRDIFERTTVDEDAIVVTPFHQAVNRLKELARGENRHGTCGMGISEAAVDNADNKNDSLLVGDLLDKNITEKKLNRIRELQLNKITSLREGLSDIENAKLELYILDQPDIAKYISSCVELYTHWSSLVGVVGADYLGRILKKPGTVVFEGAQGALLDQHFGFRPYVTKSSTTFENADVLISEQNYNGEVTKLGLVRGFPTRHGPGPFVTEDFELTKKFQDPHNLENPWQGKFRIGFFDFLATKYALKIVGGIDTLVISCLDQLEGYPKKLVCKSYEFDGNKIIEIEYQKNLTKILERCSPVYEDYSFLDARNYAYGLADDLDIPLSVLSFGPSAKEKIKR